MEKENLKQAQELKHEHQSWTMVHKDQQMSTIVYNEVLIDLKEKTKKLLAEVEKELYDMREKDVTLELSKKYVDCQKAKEICLEILG